jgi:DNA processing protein
MTTCCETCLRHSHLIAHLSPRIAGILDRPGRRVSGVLRLGEDELIERVAAQHPDGARRFVQEFDAESATGELERREILAVCQHSEDYPAGLLALDDPPRVLYCTATLERLRELLAEPAATIVGGRSASPYAIEVAHDLGRGVAVAGLTVVSGLALGIDAAAHRGAVDAGGKAIAVLACGPDVVYPMRHGRLYRDIRRKGAVLSEMPPGTRALRWGFPARNRIMAALGEITVVVEARDPSGSLITASFAGDLGRSVGAVPGRVTGGHAAGSNRLLRDGAAVIRGPEDVLDEVFGIGNGPRTERTGEKRRSADALDSGLRQVLGRVEAGDSVGEIAVATGLPVAAVRAALGQLEREGYIVAAGLGRYERAAGG